MALAVYHRKALAEVYDRGTLALVAEHQDEEKVREEIEEVRQAGATALKIRNYEELTALPDEVGELKVYKLSVDNNYVLRKIPPTICNLAERLEELNLSYNALEELPAEICSLRYLQRLLVSNNRLRCVPTDMDKLSSLEELNLDNNYITAFPPNIGYMKKLKRFFISNNPLVDEDDVPHAPFHPPSVTDCDLCKSSLEGGKPILVMNFIDICVNKGVPVAYFLCSKRCELIVNELRDSEQTNYRILQYNA
eukprot:TRINITY_DN18277_c0_g1_i1.p1 TRINITY_DN18277_c0_g1~~TRINITY_DN18277_c0_g1_i1.p1  ORF type:complete len:272 (+),score=118.59 TRINITY_DN18277_c0_g1_i1:66-818(+)